MFCINSISGRENSGKEKARPRVLRDRAGGKRFERLLLPVDVGCVQKMMRQQLEAIGALQKES